MPKRGKGPNWPPWQAKEKNETPYIGITRRTRRNKAFKLLSGNQKNLILFFWEIVGANHTGKPTRHLPREDFPGYGPYAPDSVFYMSRSIAVKEELYDRDNRRYYDDMKALERHGFIKRISRGGIGHASIYKVLPDWED